MTPKSVWIRKAVLDVPANVAEIYFNDAYNGIMQVMNQLNITMGFDSCSFCPKSDATQSERSLIKEVR